VKSDIWKVAVVKATNHVVSEPKEKHVQVILRGTFMGGSVMDKLTPTGAILHQLGKRLQWKDWIVVLKTMIVFHRIFQDGNPLFAAFLAQNASNIFRFHGYIEQTSEAVMNMPLILSYSQYLERWCLTKKRIDWPERSQDGSPYASPGVGFMPSMLNGPQMSGPSAGYGRGATGTNVERVRGPSRFQECDFLQLVEEVPYLQDNLDLLLAVRLEFSNTNSPPARGAVRLCLRDLVELLPALANAIQNLVEQFYSVDTPEILESAFEIYRRYLDQDLGVAQYLKQCQSLGLNQAMPNIMRPSQGVLDEMFDHMERVKMGDIPRIRGDELDSNDQDISSDNPEAGASQTHGTADSLKEMAAETETIPVQEASKDSGAVSDIISTNKNVVVAATQTENDRDEAVSGNVRAIAPSTSSNSGSAALALGQQAALQNIEEQQHQSTDRPGISRRSPRVKASAAIENRESSKPKEFDLLALLEGSSDSDENIASESDSSASGSPRKDAREAGATTATGLRSDKRRGKISAEKKAQHNQHQVVEAGTRHGDPFMLGGTSSEGRPDFATQGAYGMYPPPYFAGMHPPMLAPPGYPPQFIPPPMPYVQSQMPSSQGDSVNGAPQYFAPMMQPQLAMQQYPLQMAPYHAPALPPPSFSSLSATQSYSGNVSTQQSFTRDLDTMQRRVTPADQHFFDLFEEAKPKK
jgi:hypothetical protein